MAQITTKALGEEETTTIFRGEEEPITTEAIGEEEPTETTMAVGEEDDGELAGGGSAFGSF